jgi:hypothetical protein
MRGAPAAAPARSAAPAPRRAPPRRRPPRAPPQAAPARPRRPAAAARRWRAAPRAARLRRPRPLRLCAPAAPHNLANRLSYTPGRGASRGCPTWLFHVPITLMHACVASFWPHPCLRQRAVRQCLLTGGLWRRQCLRTSCAGARAARPTPAGLPGGRRAPRACDLRGDGAVAMISLNGFAPDAPNTRRSSQIATSRSTALHVCAAGRRALFAACALPQSATTPACRTCRAARLPATARRPPGELQRAPLSAAAAPPCDGRHRAAPPRRPWPVRRTAAGRARRGRAGAPCRRRASAAAAAGAAARGRTPARTRGPSCGCSAGCRWPGTAAPASLARPARAGTRPPTRRPPCARPARALRASRSCSARRDRAARPARRGVPQQPPQAAPGRPGVGRTACARRISQCRLLDRRTLR